MAHLRGVPELGREPAFEDEPWSLPTPVHALVFASLGVLSTMAALQLWSAMEMADQPLLWWSGRALGFLAYVALWMSMLFGSLVSSGGAAGLVSRKWVMDFHQEWTLAAVIATVLHVVVLVTHEESHVTPWAAIIPFASQTLTIPVALGTIGGLGLAVLAISSWLRARVPYTAWRALHTISFGVMSLALLHAILVGTDSETPAATWLYIGTATALTGVMVFRVALALLPTRRGAL
ncbi:MAG: hypothetical protein DWI58_08840 [Chloroflexi bacterium]|nr:MAG: hypothetical protein DWI58_08840 [Chloroflexota bacterium]